ncbi:MAG: BatD family protein [Myxococcota bacterium]|nr:BatD family protein [Myxococcota bacterium]
MIHILWCLLIASVSWAGEVELNVEGSIYAGVPFVLAVNASDFEETPEPEVAPFSIPGCSIQYLGMSPSVSTQMRFVNGQRSVYRDVRFVYRYQVEAKAAGSYNVPSIEVKQGSDVAKSTPATFVAEEVGTTKDLAIRLRLPERAVRVGETVPLYVDLYLRKNINDQLIVVPLFDQVQNLTVSAPKDAQGRTLAVTTAAGELDLPFTRENAQLNGVQYTRFRMEAVATFLKAGELKVAPAKIVAQLPTGRSRDRFGFPSQSYSLFRAEDKEHTLRVQPLPLQGRPKSFAGAVGQSFSIEVRAKRTVVKVGEPIELEITIRGKGRMAGLKLPDLYAAGLDKDIFDRPREQPIGEDLEEGVKQFKVSVQLKSSQAREIPSLEFSYFDSKNGTYIRSHSQPIALSVEDSAVVSANNVVRKESTPSPTIKEAAETTLSLSGADLSISSKAPSADGVLTIQQSIRWASILYLFSLVLGGFFIFRRRTQGSRQIRARSKKMDQALKQALENARTTPAQESAKPLCSALQKWGKQQGINVRDVVAKIEIEAYAPSAQTEKIRNETLQEIEQIIKNPISAIVLLLFVASLGGGVLQEAYAENLIVEEARETYAKALSESDRGIRIETFTQAKGLFEKALENHPHAPELLTDFGNASLGAGHRGDAAFGYRQALLLNPSLRRAEQNLSWLENQLPSWAQASQQNDPLRKLLIWPALISPAQQILFSGFVFALLIALLLSRRPRLQPFAIVLGLIWLSLVVSASNEAMSDPIAIVQAEAGPLRAADNDGAPAVTSEWLPEGCSVRILREQALWVEVVLGNGRRGGLPKRAITRLQRP